MTTKLTRYSPGAYGAMVPDSDGDYVRLSEIEPRIRRAVDNAKDSGIFAGSLIAEENAQELAKLHDLLRWRKVGSVPHEPTNPSDGCFSMGVCPTCRRRCEIGKRVEGMALAEKGRV